MFGAESTQLYKTVAET